MRPHAIFSGQEKSHITMMIGLIYPMNERWRPALLPGRITAVTGGAIFIESLFAGLRGNRQLGNVDDNNWLSRLYLWLARI